MAAGDDEIRDRVRAGAKTVEKLEAGKKVTGWPRAGGIVGEEVIERVKDWLLPRIRLTSAGTGDGITEPPVPDPPTLARPAR